LKINLKNNEERNHGRENKKKNLFLGILFDAVGMSLRCLCLASFQMSFGHRWQHILTRMYKGTAGKVEGW
jgi:hypothetical protein